MKIIKLQYDVYSILDFCVISIVNFYLFYTPGFPAFYKKIQNIKYILDLYTRNHSKLFTYVSKTNKQKPPTKKQKTKHKQGRREKWSLVISKCLSSYIPLIFEKHGIIFSYKWNKITWIKFCDHIIIWTTWNCNWAMFELKLPGDWFTFDKRRSKALRDRLYRVSWSGL